jgi:hypothetical protein
MYLNKYDPELLEDKKLQFLFKNLKEHFQKLFYSVIYINKIQGDEDFIKNYNRTNVVSISAIEYCYYKISTIWDIAYQIADKLIFPKDKGKGFKKYEYLEQKFKEYTNHLNALKLDWYKNVNEIRNRITHGGIAIISYYINDKNIKNRICFQAYDFDQEDLIHPHYLYSNVQNNDISFADNYFTFYTHLLYSYLIDLFEFILIELSKSKNHDIENLKFNEFFYEYFERGHKTWLLSDVDRFSEITKKMIALELAEGCLNHIDKVKSENIIKYLDRFPFIMMCKINEGDFVLNEQEPTQGGS